MKRAKILRRSFSVILALALAVSLLAVSVLADSSGDWEYSITNGEATVTKYVGNAAAVTIPSALGGCPVTNIGDEAFCNCTDVTSVSIPNTVTRIGCGAFEECSSLTDITIPGSVTRIEEYAFGACTSLTSVTIHAGVTYIGDRAFTDCTAMTSITVAAGNQNYCSIDGILYSADRKILYACPGGKGGEVSIPSGVTTIEPFAFNDCSELTGVTIPNSVTSIGDAAFQACSSLTSFTIPDGVTSIGTAMLNSCRSLTSLTIPASVTKIENAAFGQCTSLTAITVAAGSNSYCSVDGVLFTADRKTLHTCPAGKSGEYMVPSGVESIAERAFFGCQQLTRVTISSSVTSIGASAFYGSNDLENVNVASGNRIYCDIGGVVYAADGRTLLFCPPGKSGEYTIPSGVTGIGAEAFASCRYLTGVTIPSGVTSIEDYTFRSCFRLASVTIPAGVTSIGKGAFSSCIDLANVYFGGSESQWAAIEIGNFNTYLLNAAIHYGQSVNPLSIRYGEKTVKAYENFQFTATGGSAPYTWRTGNTSVAIVDSTGKVTGKAAGNTYLYCRDANGNEVKCLLKITANPLSIRFGEKSIAKGTVFQFTASGGSGSYTWRTGNTGIATVDSTGKVTGAAIGSTYLYCTDSAGNQVSCLLKIVAPLSIRYSEKSVTVGGTFQFAATGGVGSKTWRVGNAGVAAVDSGGKVTGVAAGNTYLYCKDSAGNEAKCLLKITGEPLSIRYGSKTLLAGGTFQFTATGGSGSYTWRVGDTAKATVDSSGKVTGKSAGNTYLYCKDSAGAEVKCLLKVVAPVSIRYSEKTVHVGSTFQFEATGGSGSYTWRTGNTSVATVDATGKVTGKAAGNTYLYCRDSYGNEVKCLLKIKA